MGKKMKLSLDDLKVQSFVTSFDEKKTKKMKGRTGFCGGESFDLWCGTGVSFCIVCYTEEECVETNGCQDPETFNNDCKSAILPCEVTNINNPFCG